MVNEREEVRMTIGQKTIKKRSASSSVGEMVLLKCAKSYNRIPVGQMYRFGGLSGPDPLGGLTIRRILVLLLLVPQIAQTKVAKSKGK
jgi:hypothetical protein